MKFPESKLAHKYLDGLKGIEIGASSHNPFGLDTFNVDIGSNPAYEKEQLRICGEVAKIDVNAYADVLPFKDEELDFVLSSHVLEHCYDPIKTLKEWVRVTKSGGYIFMIIPHKERMFDKDREETNLKDILEREPMEYFDHHWNVWTPESFKEIINWGLDLWDLVEIQDTDDKVGNGFTVVLRVK